MHACVVRLAARMRYRRQSFVTNLGVMARVRHPIGVVGTLLVFAVMLAGGESATPHATSADIAEVPTAAREQQLVAAEQERICSAARRVAPGRSAAIESLAREVTANARSMTTLRSRAALLAELQRFPGDEAQRPFVDYLILRIAAQTLYNVRVTSCRRLLEAVDAHPDLYPVDMLIPAAGYDLWRLSASGPTQAAAARVAAQRMAAALRRAWDQGIYRDDEDSLVESVFDLRLDDPDVAAPIEEVALAIAQSQPDGWYACALRGVVSARRAWRTRGFGWGRTVTEHGWSGFRSGLGDAKVWLEKAYALSPRHRSVTNALLDICYARGDGDAVDVWERRAIEVNPNDTKPYRLSLRGCATRMGGNWDDMLAIGERAAATEAFETSVPAVYFEALQQIIVDGWSNNASSDAIAYVTRPEVVERAIAIAHRYRDAAPASPTGRSLATTCAASLLWLAGRRAEAKDLIATLAEDDRASWLALPLVDWDQLNAPPK